MQSSGIVLLLDLSQSTSRALIPFQLDYCRRFIQMQLSGNETDISKTLACRQLTHDGVILARKVECKVNRTAERVLIIVLQNGNILVCTVNPFGDCICISGL